MNWLERQLLARPDEMAVNFASGGSWTWKELGERVSRMAAALQSAGVRADSRVATLLGNTPFHVSIIHAIPWVGATLVPVNTRLTDSEISWMLSDLEIDLLVVDHESLGRELELGATRFVQVEELTRSFAIEPRPFMRETLATILYTSGTTGLPKPVPLSWENHAASAMASAVNLGMHRDDNWLAALPLYHIGGLSIVYRSALYGTAFTLTDQFDEHEIGRLVGDGTVTLASLVPTMLRRLWAGENRSEEEFALECDAGRLRAILLGGGPADRASLELCKRHEIPVYQTYGLTEGCSQITTMPPSRSIEKIGSAGLPVFGADVSIRDDEGYECDTNEEGTINIRGPMVTSGYIDRSAENERRFRNGWFDTGDWGRRDEEGFLWVVSRRNDLIVTGGENVYPAEIEQVIGDIAGVAEVAVFGLDDEEWGQKVCAAIVVEPGTDLEAIEAQARESLAGFKMPKLWHRLDALPRTASGKVKRIEVADLVLSD